MKKQFLTIFFVLLILLFSATAVSGNSQDDFRVIKKSENLKGDSDDLTVFKILVTDSASNKVKFRLTLPICLVDLITECLDDFQIDKNRCAIDLKRVLGVLRTKGHLYLIEACDENETVKIWFE